ncbi:MAG: hypothetical protein KKI02_12270 [Planctomycetes bacterium]|nr:hypothetical protein [Planctomycetota bacterium]
MQESRKAEGFRDASPIALAAAVADRVEIRDVRLIRCTCHQSPKAAQINQFDAKLHRQTNVQIEKSKNTIAVIAHFEFSGRAAAQPADADPDFHLSADFLILYTAKSLSGLTKLNFEKFGELNGTYNAWPYWREFLHNTMSRMQLKPFVLPVFRITGPAQAAKRHAESERKRVSPATE